MGSPEETCVLGFAVQDLQQICPPTAGRRATVFEFLILFIFFNFSGDAGDESLPGNSADEHEHAGGRS